MRADAAVTMKRWAALLLAASLALGACSKPAPPEQRSAGPAGASPRLNNALPPPPPSVDTSSSAAPQPALPPQLSETGTTETLDTPAAGAQPMALKITQIAPPSAPAPQWKEGVNYRVLVPVQPTGALPGQVEVIEAFWYGCPHCNALDPLIEQWRKQGRPNYVSFVRLPVMWGAVHRTHARVFYTAELLGKLDELHSQIFGEIHNNHDSLTTPEQIAAFFIAHGVSDADFQKAFSSFAVEASLKRALDLGLRYEVQSVPTFIVNGKYVTDVGMAGGPQQLITLVNDLAAREKGT